MENQTLIPHPGRLVLDPFPNYRGPSILPVAASRESVFSWENLRVVHYQQLDLRWFLLQPKSELALQGCYQRRRFGGPIALSFPLQPKVVLSAQVRGVYNRPPPPVSTESNPSNKEANSSMEHWEATK